MALPDFKKIPPVTIHEFRNINELEPLNIPELAKNRKITDIAFLIFFLISIACFICLISVSSSINTDFKRFLHGYDKCGDTCGIDNKKKENIQCSGKDLTHEPIMKFRFTGEKNGSKWIVKNHIIPHECVEQCEEQKKLWKLSRLIYSKEFVHDLRKSINVMILPMCAISLFLSICLFFCLYYIPERTIWGIISLSLCGLFIFTIYVWYWFIKDTTKKQLMYVGIAATIVTFFVSIFFCYFYDRYVLVVAMFQEATESVFNERSLTVVPIMTILFLFLVAVGKAFLSCLISTNQDLKELDNFPGVHKYTMTTLAQFAIVYIVLMFIWLNALCNGCQCMVIAGPIAAHYFVKLNETPASRYPVLTSCYVVFKYHFGTIAFGSLCITILTVARVLLDFFEDHLNCKCANTCLQCWLACLEGIVEYLTKRAYIETALHGKSLYKSGMRATRLLWCNLMDTVALDIVADFIVCCATMLVILVAVAVAMIIHEAMHLQLYYFWTMLLTGAVACGSIVYFFMQIINVAVETIFMCFCEDKMMNNGQNKPYLMSERLKKLIDKAKEATRRREEA